MPVQYSSIMAEHKAVRTKAGLFDVSHMGEFIVKGDGAAEFLDRLMTNSIATCEPGKAVYTLMCDKEGMPIDDLIVYRLADDRFLLCVNASNSGRDLDWIERHSGGIGCTVEDVSESYGLLAVQGPLAERIVSTILTWPDLASLGRFRLIEREWSGIPLIVARTGYTGEDGFEIFCPAENAEIIAEALLTSGEPMGMLPCGLGARDSLRLEAGFPLYGHEIGEDRDPISAGLGWVIKWDKETAFTGKDALRKIKEEGASHRLVHFILGDRRIAREGTAVLQDDREVGVVVSGTMSPMLNKPIGAARIRRDAVNEGLEVELRGNRVALGVRKPPLHLCDAE